MSKEKDFFKSLGIVVGNDRSYTYEPAKTARVADAAESHSTQVVRKGANGNPRDNLEAQLAKGGVYIKSSKELEHEEIEKAAKQSKKKDDEGLKDTHGEQFHQDNDKQVEDFVSSSEEIHLDEEEVQKEKSLSREALLLKALGDLTEKAEKPPFKITKKMKQIMEVHENSEDVVEKKHVGKSEAASKKISKLVHEGKPQKQAVATALNMEREGRLSPSGEYKHAKKSEAEEALDDLIKAKYIKREGSPGNYKYVYKENPHLKTGAAAAESQRQSVAAFQKRSNAIKQGKQRANAVRQESAFLRRLQEARKEARKSEDFDLLKAGKTGEGSRGGKIIGHKSVNPHIKAIGKGGIVFDFGDMTGNKIADEYTQILRSHSDPVQNSTVQYQNESYNKALVDYVNAGGAKNDQTEQTAVGTVAKGWGDMLNKPMDEQVKEAMASGAFDGNTEMGKVKGEFNAAQINVGGEIVKGQSETDAAVIEMMKAQGVDLSGMEYVPTTKISICAGDPLPTDIAAE